MIRFHVHILLHNGENTIDFEEAKKTLCSLFTHMYLVSPKARLDVSKTESYSFSENNDSVKLDCLAVVISGMELTDMRSFVSRYIQLLKISNSNVSIFYDKHEVALE